MTSKKFVVLPALPSPTTYSIRLGKPEKALLARALDAKGWTATHFIKQATLEKAAHVDNTSHFTDFDFDSLARRLAKQLCEPVVKVGDATAPEDGLRDFSRLLEAMQESATGHQLSPDLYGTTEPPPLTASDVELFRKAVHYGGLEFLRRVLDECDRLVVHQRSDLPAPVDPAKLG